LVSRVKCHECDNLSETVEIFYDLSMSISTSEDGNWKTVEHHKNKPAVVDSEKSEPRTLSKKEQRKLGKMNKKDEKMEEKPKENGITENHDENSDDVDNNDGAENKELQENKEDNGEKLENKEENLGEQTNGIMEEIKEDHQENGTEEKGNKEYGGEEEEGENKENEEKQENAKEDAAGESNFEYNEEGFEHDKAEVSEVVLEDRTLGERYVPRKGECSIESCLDNFCTKEILSGANKFGCAKCFQLQNKQTAISPPSTKRKTKVFYTNATKQFLIKEAPRILTLHLKRFEQRAFNLVRIAKNVSFKATLDLAPFCTSDCKIGKEHKASKDGENLLKEEEKPSKMEVLYDLYAVVVHRGNLNSGHYTAYVKLTVGEKRRWFYISDSHVTTAAEESVLSCEGAYILFYERRD